MSILACGSTTNIVRQYEAIKCLPYMKPHLQQALFTSYIADSSSIFKARKPKSVPMDIWKSLKNSHNMYQLKSISQILTGSCKNNTCLVQGMLIAIVLLSFNRSNLHKDFYYSHMAGPPGMFVCFSFSFISCGISSVVCTIIYCMQARASRLPSWAS